MENSILLMILLQLFLILLNAIFACAEIAVISMNDTKLAKLASEGDKRAIRLARLTSEPARFLATIQVAITLSGFLGSAFAADNFSGMIVDGLISLGVKIPADVLNSISVIVITLILSYFTLVLGELVPKQLAMRKAEPMALALSTLISVIAKICAPIVSFLTVSTNGVLRLLGIDPNVEEENVSEEEIRMMVDVGSEKGTIDNDEREIIQNVFEFDDLSADEINTHRTEVVMLDMDDPAEVWKDVIYTSRYTLYPVFEGSIDNIVGVLNTKDYFRLEDKSKDNILMNAVKPPYFVIDTVKADTLFRNMKKAHQGLAIVLDEYGGMSGIITINDLVKQLLGDLGDDEEEEELPIVKVDENTWMIQGDTATEDIEEALNISLGDECDTLSGLILHELGSIPEDGAEVEIDVMGMHINSAKVVNHQVESAMVYYQKIEEE